MSLIYSVVVPVKNEEKNIEALLLEVEAVMQPLGKPWELIFINDGSDDRSAEVLNRLLASKPFLRVIEFDQNYGQTHAFDAGFKAARGQWVITMDGDRQNDPKDIPRLIEAMGEADLICGWRRDRKDTFVKRIVSKFSNAVRSRVCQDGVHDTGCSLKVFRRSCLQQLKLYKGMHRFFPALFLIEGFSVKELPVNDRKRVEGVTKYGFYNRLLGPITDMFVVYWMRKRALRYRIQKELP